MKIVVLIKEVPDTYSERSMNLETGLVDRSASEAVVDEINERALEVALAYSDDNPGTEVIVLSLGPATAVAALRKGLAMGAGRAVHVLDSRLLGADTRLTAEVIAAALAREGFDLVIAGNLSTDGAGGVVPSMVAEHLGVPAATSLSALSIEANSVTGTRLSELGATEVRASLPAVVSITESLPDARFPNFKGIMGAKKKPYETIGLDLLDVDVDDESKGRSIVIGITERPARAAGTTIVDEGDGGRQLANFLIKNRLA